MRSGRVGTGNLVAVGGNAPNSGLGGEPLKIESCWKSFSADYHQKKKLDWKNWTIASEWGELSEAEYNELLTRIERVEHQNVQIVAALMELAQLRKVDLVTKDARSPG